MAELEHQVHDNLVEGIVVADDALLERYLEGEEIRPSRSSSTPSPTAWSASGVPGGVRLGRHRRRRRPAGDFIVRDRTVARRPATGHGREAGDTTAEVRPIPTASRWPSCSRRSPTRTSASCRCSRC
jgi:hypothetical protein